MDMYARMGPMKADDPPCTAGRRTPNDTCRMVPIPTTNMLEASRRANNSSELGWPCAQTTEWRRKALEMRPATFVNTC